MAYSYTFIYRGESNPALSEEIRVYRLEEPCLDDTHQTVSPRTVDWEARDILGGLYLCPK